MWFRSVAGAIGLSLLVLPAPTGHDPLAALQRLREADWAMAAAPAQWQAFRQIGTASWYGAKFHGRLTASGQRFDRRRLTAAHRTLPLGTRARIVNLANGRSVEVTVTDRGPYVRGRIIDLSEKAAQLLGMTKEGLAAVAIEVRNGSVS
ncbi:MAG TPA: septal ring lytic transglycosylase RlpA family protein [Stellaceae bacterium]|nr:septal ring lytic transglycosylase RlpA family protein [Stellaceae bacterium]